MADTALVVDTFVGEPDDSVNGHVPDLAPPGVVWMAGGNPMYLRAGGGMAVPPFNTKGNAILREVPLPSISTVYGEIDFSFSKRADSTVESFDSKLELFVILNDSSSGFGYNAYTRIGWNTGGTELRVRTGDGDVREHVVPVAPLESIAVRLEGDFVTGDVRLLMGGVLLDAWTLEDYEPGSLLGPFTCSLEILAEEWRNSGDVPLTIRRCELGRASGSGFTPPFWIRRLGAREVV